MAIENRAGSTERTRTGGLSRPKTMTPIKPMMDILAGGMKAAQKRIARSGWRRARSKSLSADFCKLAFVHVCERRERSVGEWQINRLVELGRNVGGRVGF